MIVLRRALRMAFVGTLCNHDELCDADKLLQEDQTRDAPAAGSCARCP